MSDNLEKWRAMAVKIKQPKYPTIPLRFQIGEALDAARSAKKYWAPADRRPGLQDLGDRLPVSIADDVASLAQAVQEAQTMCRLIVDNQPDTKGLLERSEDVITELTAALEWHFDDGVEDENDLRLIALKQANKDQGRGSDARAQELLDYATLAEPHADKLHGKGGFDKAIIQEAKELSVKLGAVSRSARSDELAAALHLRDQLADLLHQKVSLVRASARFAFRNHPEIIREFTSSYERHRRAEARRAQKNAPQ